jgi:signal transduction histidine kinase
MISPVNKDNTLLETAFIKMPVPLVMLKADAPKFTISTANEAYCSVTGRSTATLVGKSLFDAFPTKPGDAEHMDGSARIKASLIRVVESGKPDEIKYQKYEIRQDGNDAFEVRYWNISSTPITDESGRVTDIIHSVTDVTHEFQLKEKAQEAERRKSEFEASLETAREEIQQADESNTLLHAIIDGAQAGIFLFTPLYDEKGRITDFRFALANKMLAAYVGQTPQTVTGALGSEWFPGYKTNGLFERYSRTAMTGNTDRFEFHYEQDGINVWLDIMCTKVQDDLLVTFTDYTALKNLQRRLEEHVSELRNSNANLEQFAYVASHDLQEPLRKVKSFGDMLANRYGEALGASGADLISRMQSAAARMSTLIEDLLTFSRASVKPRELEVIDTNKVLDGILFDLERVIQQKKAVIHRDALLPVAGQATQVGQIFLNLISNALKFQAANVPPEISITSSVIKGKDAGFWMSSQDMDRSFQLIRIQDNGIGFDNAYRDRIFQIFQRLNNRSDYPGSGVGLSIVKKVVENHGGYIDATSEQGKGSTFSILLPIVSIVA